MEKTNGQATIPSERDRAKITSAYRIAIRNLMIRGIDATVAINRLNYLKNQWGELR